MRAATVERPSDVLTIGNRNVLYKISEQQLDVINSMSGFIEEVVWPGGVFKLTNNWVLSKQIYFVSGRLQSISEIGIFIRSCIMLLELC